MQLCNWHTFKLSTRILKDFLMDVDFKNPVRVRVREDGGGRR
jgi:hypothetical protein